MTIRITKVHFDGPNKTHQAITRFYSIEDGTGNVFDRDKATMVDWLDNKNITAYVASGASRVPVEVVRDTPPYLRTRANGVLSDNLLSLDTY